MNAYTDRRSDGPTPRAAVAAENYEELVLNEIGNDSRLNPSKIPTLLDSRLCPCKSVSILLPRGELPFKALLF